MFRGRTISPSQRDKLFGRFIAWILRDQSTSHRRLQHRRTHSPEAPARALERVNRRVDSRILLLDSSDDTALFSKGG
jgi:hypothetical protein